MNSEGLARRSFGRVNTWSARGHRAMQHRGAWFSAATRHREHLARIIRYSSFPVVGKGSPICQCR